MPNWNRHLPKDPPAGSSAAVRAGGPSAFTLVELILVMALLVILLAVVVPDVSRSLRQRNLEQEASRLLALTEYGRDEAASQGIPMDVWVDATRGAFGVSPKVGYTGTTARNKSYRLNESMHFDPVTGGVIAKPGQSASGNAGNPGGSGLPGVVAAEFSPDGTLDPSSVASIRIADRTNNGVALSQTTDGYGYRIVKDGAP